MLSHVNPRTLIHYSALVLLALAMSNCDGNSDDDLQAADLFGYWEGHSYSGLLRLHFFEDSGRNRYELLAPEGLLIDLEMLDNILSVGVFGIYGRELQISDDGTGALNCPSNLVDTFSVYQFNDGENISLEHTGMDCDYRGQMMNSVEMWTHTSD